MKWINGSLTFNITSFLSLIALLLLFYPFDPELGDIVGFYYFFYNFILLVILIVFFLIEIIFYKLNNNFAFCLPFYNLKYFKFLYYPLFYFGLYKMFIIALPFAITWIKHPSYSPMDVFVKLMLFGF